MVSLRHETRATPCPRRTRSQPGPHHRLQQHRPFHHAHSGTHHLQAGHLAGESQPLLLRHARDEGHSIPAGRGERIDSITWGFGSGQWGFRSIRIDRSGIVTTVDRGGHEQDVDDYRQQRYHVPPTAAIALLESPTLRRCLRLRPYYAAVGINDGGQDFLHIDSDQHTRRFWFNNHSPPALQHLGKELEAWLQQVPATRTGRPQRVSAFQVSRDYRISESLRGL